MGLFVRSAAVFVGLANLLILSAPALRDALLSGGDLADRSGGAVWGPILLSVLAVVIVGLATSEIVLRWMRPAIFAERFLDRYFNSVVVVCLGGVIMGGLLAYVLTLNVFLHGPFSISGPVEMMESLLRSLGPGLLGAAFGLGLGLVEGLILAFPLAAILGRFGN